MVSFLTGADNRAGESNIPTQSNVETEIRQLTRWMSNVSHQSFPIVLKVQKQHAIIKTQRRQKNKETQRRTCGRGFVLNDIVEHRRLRFAFQGALVLDGCIATKRSIGNVSWMKRTKEKHLKSQQSTILSQRLRRPNNTNNHNAPLIRSRASMPCQLNDWFTLPSRVSPSSTASSPSSASATTERTNATSTNEAIQKQPTNTYETTQQKNETTINLVVSRSNMCL